MVSKLLRHLAVGVFSLVLIYILWSGHIDIQGHKIWRALGDASFILLSITLLIGPLAKIFPYFQKIIPWRRQFGIWFFIIGLLHFLLIFDGYFGWDIMVLLGYKLQRDTGEYLLFSGGFGIGNVIGITSLFLAMLLAATSSDKAIQLLGGSSWKRLHMTAHAIFYLSVMHYISFTFFHQQVISYTRFFLLGLTFLVLTFQLFAYIKTTKSAKQNNKL
jgi:methionine sulfoxide reductase heme-binding subunit